MILAIFFDGYTKGYNKMLNLCYNKISKTPTGSIIPWYSFAFLGKTLLNQRFLFLWYSLVFFCEKGSHKQTLKQTLFLKKGYKKGYNIFVVS